MAQCETSRRKPFVREMVRPHLLRLAGYQPIRPVDAVSDEGGRPAAGILKLDGNENPYGCSPRVRQALAEYPWFHLYPDPEQKRLRRALASYVGMGAEYIVAGVGNDEIIDLLLRLVLAPGEGVVNCVPTFGIYQFITEVCDGCVISVPRRADYSLDMPGVQQALSGTKAVFIASPNNPSGNLTPSTQPLRWLHKKTLRRFWRAARWWSWTRPTRSSAARHSSP